MEHQMSTVRRSKKAVNVSISADLLQAARNSEINLSATLEAAVEHELRQLRKREWLEQNENAIQAYTATSKSKACSATVSVRSDAAVFAVPESQSSVANTLPTAARHPV
jgi:antitoxin CcdA